jgi:hypothetical protein
VIRLGFGSKNSTASPFSEKSLIEEERSFFEIDFFED